MNTIYPYDGNGEPIQAEDSIYQPSHYTDGAIETIDIIESVVNGLPSVQAYLLGNVIKYVCRAGKKGNVHDDLAKANNYAHRLVSGEWKHG